MTRRIYVPFDWTTFEEPLVAPRAGARACALADRAGRNRRRAPARTAGVRPRQERRQAATASCPRYRGFRFSHVGYDDRRAAEDPDVVFPLSLLRRLAAEGEIGKVAPRAGKSQATSDCLGATASAQPPRCNRLAASAVEEL